VKIKLANILPNQARPILYVIEIESDTFIGPQYLGKYKKAHTRVSSPFLKAIYYIRAYYVSYCSQIVKDYYTSSKMPARSKKTIARENFVKQIVKGIENTIRLRKNISGHKFIRKVITNISTNYEK